MDPTETNEVNSTSRKLKGAVGKLMLFQGARSLGESHKRLVSEGAHVSLRSLLGALSKEAYTGG